NAAFGDHGTRRQEPQGGQGAEALAGAGGAQEAQGLARLQAPAHLVQHGRGQRRLGARPLTERDAQAFQAQAAHACPLGSKYSRARSPTWFTRSITVKIIKPGKNDNHQASVMASRPLFSRLPQLAWGACTPRPRSESPDSRSMA